MHSGIHEIQHKVNEQARRRIDHQEIARRSHQVARESASQAGRSHVGTMSKFASDIAFDFASAIVIIAVIAVGAAVMGQVMSAQAAVGDPVDIFNQPEAPGSEAPKASVPDLDNGDPNDDPMVVKIPDLDNSDPADDPVVDPPADPGRSPGQAAPVPPMTREDVGVPLPGNAPGRNYLFAGHGDDADAPSVEAQALPLPPIPRPPGSPSPLLPLDDTAPGRWYLFASHGDDTDDPNG